MPAPHFAPAMARHADLEQRLNHSYQSRAKVGLLRRLFSWRVRFCLKHRELFVVQELKAGLSTAAGLENDVLLAALKRSPATAPLAAARAQELLADLLPAHYGCEVHTTSGTTSEDIVGNVPAALRLRFFRRGESLLTVVLNVIKDHC